MNKQQMMQNRFWSRFAAVLLGGLSLAFLAPVAIGQQYIGRTQASGNWTDGHWSDENGTSGPPGSNDYAYIGVFSDLNGWTGDTSVNLNVDAEVSGLYLGDGTSFGALTINAGVDLQAGIIQIESGSILNLNGSLGVLNLYANGGTINQDGALAAGSMWLGWAGEATTYNRTGGSLYLQDLNLDSASSFSLLSGDVLTSAVVANGSTLAIDSQIGLTNVAVNNATLILNDHIETTWFLALDNATLVRNNNASISTAALYLTGMDYELNGIDNIWDTVQISSGNLDITNSNFIPSAIIASQATVNVLANISTSYIQMIEDSTLNINQLLDFTGGTLYASGGTINQNADIVGGLLFLDSSLNPTIMNRTSGVMTLTELTLYGSDLALGSGDSVLLASIYTGSTLTINAPMQMGGITVGESTLILNDSLALDNYVSLYQATVIRNTGGSFSTPDMYVSTMDYQLDGTDNVSNSFYFDNGTLDVTAATSLSTFAASQAIVNLDAVLIVSSFALNNSTLNLNASLQADNVYINGGEIVQNADIVASNMFLGNSDDAFSFQRIFGSLTVQQLQLDNGTQLDLSGIDSVAGVTQFGSSMLTYQQLDGQMTGLDLQGLLIDSGSNLNLLFDGVNGDGLDWGLRLAGDQQFLLNELLSDGRLTSNWMEAGVVYNVGAYGDYTYFGAFTAVPEPSSGTLVAFAVLAVTLRRRQRRS